MKTYVCYYSCPFCPHPCCTDWEGEANEMFYADSKTEAKKYFNNSKQCRYMKITRIEEYKDGVSDVSVTIDGKEIKCESLSEAIEKMSDAHFAGKGK